MARVGNCLLRNSLDGANVLTSVGRACGLRSTGVKRSARPCEAARRAQPPPPLASQACCLLPGWEQSQGSRGFPGKQKIPEPHVVLVLASEIEEYTTPGPREDLGPAPILPSWLLPSSLSSGLLLSRESHETWRIHGLPPKLSSPSCPCLVGTKGGAALQLVLASPR